MRWRQWISVAIVSAAGLCLLFFIVARFDKSTRELEALKKAVLPAYQECSPTELQRAWDASLAVLRRGENREEHVLLALQGMTSILLRCGEWAMWERPNRDETKDIVQKDLREAEALFNKFRESPFEYVQISSDAALTALKPVRQP